MSWRFCISSGIDFGVQLTARLNTWWFMDSQLLFVHNLSCLSCRLGILTYSRRRSFKWVWKYGSNSGWSLLISRALSSNSTVSKAEDSPVVPNSFEIKPGIHDTSFASKSPFKKTWIKKTWIQVCVYTMQEILMNTHKFWEIQQTKWHFWEERRVLPFVLHYYVQLYCEGD